MIITGATTLNQLIFMFPFCVMIDSSLVWRNVAYTHFLPRDHFLVLLRLSHVPRQACVPPKRLPCCGFSVYNLLNSPQPAPLALGQSRRYLEVFSGQHQQPQGASHANTSPHFNFCYRVSHPTSSHRYRCFFPASSNLIYMQ